MKNFRITFFAVCFPVLVVILLTAAGAKLATFWLKFARGTRDRDDVKDAEERRRKSGRDIATNEDTILLSGVVLWIGTTMAANGVAEKKLPDY